MAELTESHIDFIRENYPNKTNSEMSKILDCSTEAFRYFVSKHNLQKRKEIILNIGDVFGQWKVVDNPVIITGSTNYRVKIVHCECLSCKQIKPVRVAGLRNGTSKSCGCYKQHLRKYTVNDNYFDVWSAEMSYILGFFIADGNISGNKFTISLQNRDVYVLEHMKSCLEYTGPIYYNDNVNRSTLSINSKVLIDKLYEHNVYERKTGKETLPPSLPDEYFYDFLRGYLDGDGCISNRPGSKRNRIITTFICVNKEFLEILREKSGNLGKISAQKTWHLWRLAHYATLALCEKIYYSDGFCLKRKKDKWLKIRMSDNEDINIESILKRYYPFPAK